MPVRRVPACFHVDNLGDGLRSSARGVGPSVFRIWVVVACLSCVCFCAAALGTFVPLRRATGIEYLFAWSGGSALITAAMAATIAVVGLYLALGSAVRRHAPGNLASARSGRWLAPTCGLALVAIGVLPAAPGVGTLAAPVAYFLYDLRWWWVVLAAGALALHADRLLGDPVRRRAAAVATWSVPARLLLLDTLLFASVVTWVVIATPRERFSSGLNGDEPKYVRYCELWYQGGGFDISQKVRLTDVPLDARPGMGRLPALLWQAIGLDASDLVSDLRRFAASPGNFRWNRARGAEGFLTGKRGGTYQLYQPGLSVLLFPGYFIDRHLLGLRPGYQQEFPDELPATNLTMLLLFGMCAVALFRLLRNALASDALAWFWAAIGLLTMPATAFAFQFYPEVPALLIVLAVANHVLFHAGDRGWVAASAAGAAAAALAWLHPRFLLVSLLLTAVGAFRLGGGCRRVLLGAGGAVYVSLLAFNYAITGSALPTALWDAAGADVVPNPLGIPVNLLGYALDRTWGVAPHSPLLLAAVPGLFLLARRSAWLAAFVAAAGLALAIPAAGHTLSAAGTTPGRLIVAVVPLLMWPVAAFVRRFWSSVAVRVATAVAVVVSLETAFSYTWHFSKQVGPLHSAGLSGWRPNLSFPVVRGDGWFSAPGSLVLVVAIVSVVAAMAILAAARPEPDNVPRSHNLRMTWAVPAVVVVLIAGLATIATAAGREWTRNDYLLDDVSARRLAATGLLELAKCRVCFTSERPAVDWRWLEPNPARDVAVDTAVEGRTVTVRARLEGDGRSQGFARMRVEFGDESATSWMGIVGEREVIHTYREAGDTYTVAVWLQLRDGTVVVRRAVIRIEGRS